MKKVVLITGASSGIGFNTANLLLKNDFIVYCAARRTELMKPLSDAGGRILFLDLTDSTSITNCIETIIRDEGKIDILINNAGYAIGGSLEDIPAEKAKQQFEVNVFGLMEITKKVLPYMRRQSSGKIINISSIAGFFSSPYLGWYHAAKYSVEALSDSLRMELKPFGVKVILIEPGLINTNWGIIAAESIHKYSGNSDYKKHAEVVENYYKRHYVNQKNLSKPNLISKAIFKAIKSKHPKCRYKAGTFCNIYLFLKKFLPDSIFDFASKIAIKYS